MISLPTFQGEVTGGGLKLPLFDIVSTGRVFHHAIFFFQARYVLSWSTSFYPHSCFEGGKAGEDKEKEKENETP